MILISFLNRYNKPHKEGTIFLLNFQFFYNDETKIGYEINRIKNKFKGQKQNILAHIAIRDAEPTNAIRFLNLLLVVNYIPDKELEIVLSNIPAIKFKVIDNLGEIIYYFK